WLCDNESDADTQSYFARRMLDFKLIQENDFLRGVFERIARGEKLDPEQRKRCERRLRLLQAEDNFYGWFFAESHLGTIRAGMKELPERYDPKLLDREAFLAGRKDAYNNVFRIKNSFYNWRIKPKLRSFKGGQAKLSYEKSPEYGDLQLALGEIARNRMNVLFVIPPVNRRWAEYTGLSKEMYVRFVQKIKTQLNKQGFLNVLDLSRQGGVDYFMQDTIHLGWRGWVAMDRAIEPFLRKETAEPEYRIDPYYLSEEWRVKVVENSRRY
ncbi:MAG: D-alanyl-lipoteichoic acid biosynthesis protein DltD, partial [Clostridiales Family XIII bacterium]|nr:D-alanyl-lipoteichoic acid biosynthesis protein DltD [Clostridiales Family XIII bacterium]